MIEIPLQIQPGYRTLSLVSREDLEKIKAYRVYQILRAKLSGHQRPRSVQQNAWAHNMFEIVAQNTEDPEWKSKERAKFCVKMTMKFFDEKNPYLYFRGMAIPNVRSFAFDQMDNQEEANRVFEEAKEICAEKIGVAPYTLEAEARKLTL